VRRASAITIFSGFTTRRTDDVFSSVRIRRTASRLRCRRSTAPKNRSPRSATWSSSRRRSHALHHAALDREDPLDVQLMISGSESRRSVRRSARSPRRAGPTDPRRHGSLTSIREKIRQTRDDRELLRLDRLDPGPAHELDHVLWISRQFCSSRACASICSAQRLAPIGVGGHRWGGRRSPQGVSRIRAHDEGGGGRLRGLHRVAAATVVLPTPPFP